MQIRITRQSNTTHCFALTRADGTSENAVLATRSFLVHDLVHYAVEGILGESSGFYGLLAAGRSLAAVNNRSAPPPEPALMQVEQLVGPLQILSQGRGDRATVEAIVAAHRPPLPGDFVEQVLQQMRVLLGRWRSTPFGHPMELTWPPEWAAAPTP